MVVNVMYIFGCHLGPLSVTESFAVCVCVWEKTANFRLVAELVRQLMSTCVEHGCEPITLYVHRHTGRA